MTTFIVNRESHRHLSILYSLESGDSAGMNLNVCLPVNGPLRP